MGKALFDPRAFQHMPVSGLSFSKMLDEALITVAKLQHQLEWYLYM